MILSSRAPAPRDAEDLKYLESVLLSGEELSGNAPIVSKYEIALASIFQVKYAIAVSSGTAALHIVLASLGIQTGDEVIIPVTGAVMSAMPILMLRAIPVYVDTMPNSFEIDLLDLKKKISSKTKCIISVPMWGYPTFDTELSEFAKIINIPVIEDAAQALGTINGSKYEGTLSYAGCFSTHELKLISTGEGGFILTNSLAFANKCKSFSKIGFSFPSSQLSEGSFGLLEGLNYKLNGLSAALGITQLSKLQKRLNIRKEKAKLWKKLLYLLDGVTEISFKKENIPNYYGIAFVVDDFPKNGGVILSERLASVGIFTDIYRYKYKILPEYKIFSNNACSSNNNEMFPNANKLLSSILVLPTHEFISNELVDQCIPKIIDLIRQMRKEY
jgi:perosamine synthetase